MGCFGITAPISANAKHPRAFTMADVNAVLRVVDWLQIWGFRILGGLVRGVTGFLARILRRGRFRPWRRGT